MSRSRVFFYFRYLTPYYTTSTFAPFCACLNISILLALQCRDGGGREGAYRRVFRKNLIFYTILLPYGERKRRCFPCEKMLLLKKSPTLMLCYIYVPIYACNEMIKFSRYHFYRLEKLHSPFMNNDFYT